MTADQPAGELRGTTNTIGLIGVGLLGSALAARLLAAGYSVRGYDLLPDRRAVLESLGGESAAHSREVFRTCGRVLLSLPDTPAVERLLREHAHDLQVGLCLIDTTTGDPARMTLQAEQLAAGGVRYLDATVVGSSEQVRQGAALMLVGGAEEVVAGCQDLLKTLAPQVFHVGPSGSGARLKLIVNLVLGLHRAVLAEGLALAAKCGLELPLVLQVLQAGPAASAVMQTKGPKMLAEDFSPQARLAQHYKDVQLILQLGQQHAARLPLTAVHEQLLREAVQQGDGGLDNSAILKRFRA